MSEKLFIPAVYFVEMLVAFIFFSRLSQKKYSSIKCWFIGTVLFECGALLNYCFSNTIWINALSFLAINITFAMICFRMPPIKVLFYSFVLFVFSTALEFATIFIVAILFSADITDYNTQPILLIIEGTISKALFFITCLVLSSFIKKDKSSSKFPLSFYAYPASTIVSLMVFWYIGSQKTISEKSQTLLAVVCFLLLISTIVLFITYQQNIEKENNYILLKSENNRLKTEKAYYDILEHQNHQLMIYAHDTKNHLATIKSLNNNPKIDKYIDKMSESLKVYSQKCNSGNMILDVIISRYLIECEMKGVSFSFDIRLNNLSFVDDFDLVSIMDNLIDNALEAAENSKKKFVTLETDYRNSYNVIIITNSCDTHPKSNNDRLITTKPDKKIHGIGLKSVSSTLKKYNGDFSWDYNDTKKEFITTIMLLNK